MEKVLGYIFGGLEMNEIAIAKIARILNKQSKTINSLAFISLLFSAYAVMNEIDKVKYNRKIKSLAMKIEELEKSKGE